MDSKKICIVTTHHPTFDIRIFYREAKTLSEQGYNVYLIAPHYKEDFIDSIKIIPTSTTKREGVYRFIGAFKAFLKALKINANVYHIHDPELIPVAIILKLLGKKVIYDVHENLALHIYSKSGIPSLFQKPLSIIVRSIEWVSLFFFTKIIIAGEDIGLQSHFQKFSSKIILLRNFPVISLSEEEIFPKPKDKISFIYTGGLLEYRGILEIIQAFKEIKEKDIELLLLGNFNSEDFKRKIIDEIKECDNIKYIPSLPYKEMFAILAKCHVGLICFEPAPNNIEALSGRNNKIYEYLQGGLAIIGSNFPSWVDFIEGHKIGLTVNPREPLQIKKAMEFFIFNPQKLQEMEYNAKKLSYKYSWELESQKLIDLYRELLG